MKNFFNRCVFLVLLGLLVACKGQPSAVLDDRCINFCWRDIRIGESTIEDAKLRLLSMSDVNKETVTNEQTSVPRMNEVIDWKFGNVEENNGEISFFENKVNGISFDFSNPISINLFITKYGEPSNILIKLIKGDPIDYLTIRILYPEKGICLLSKESLLPLLSSNHYSVNTNTDIKEVYFTGSAYPDEQLTVGCLRGMSEKEYQSRIQNWKGYGTYNDVNNNGEKP